MPRGDLCLVLHAHLPYVRHPEHPSFLEETWLFEAITECYLPLIRVFDRLVADGVPFRVTLSVSPPLVNMLADPFLQERYLAHIDKLSRLAEKETIRTTAEPQLLELARLYQRLFHDSVEAYENQLGRDLIGAFKRLQAAGRLELITTGATHGFLPLLKPVPAAVSAQVAVAVATHERAFGQPPAGIWLPECGYFPGLEETLKAHGLKYFFVEAHGILNAEETPRDGVMAPLACPNGVCAFGRDPDSSRLVWSSHEGYPGDPMYRDFYKDIGHDLDFDYIRPFILDGETRIQTGIKYHRITGDAGDKALYDPAAATERADVHAKDFLDRKVAQARKAVSNMGRSPAIVAPYDAELFGHWWFEGPQWLDLLIRKLAYDQDTVRLATPSDHLRDTPQVQVARPSASTWGDQGYNAFWLNPGNDWIYPHLHDAAHRMHALASAHGKADAASPRGRALAQAARSLLLAQASDWPFIMKTGAAVDYAYGRIRDHLARFHHLADAVESGDVDMENLAALEAMDAIFPDIDPGVYG